MRDPGYVIRDSKRVSRYSHPGSRIRIALLHPATRLPDGIIEDLRSNYVVQFFRRARCERKGRTRRWDGCGPVYGFSVFSQRALLVAACLERLQDLVKAEAADFWLGGNSLNVFRKPPTYCCAGTSRNVRSALQWV